MNTVTDNLKSVMKWQLVWWTSTSPYWSNSSVR